MINIQLGWRITNFSEVVFNLLWNMGILLSVKHAGALATFVALKAIFPVAKLQGEFELWARGLNMW